MLQWFVARTRPGHERSASEQILALGFSVYAPLYRDGVRTHPVFPSYLFAEFCLDSDQWEVINDQRHIVRLMPFHVPEPTPVPTKVVNWFRQREELGEFPSHPGGSLRLKYRPGDAVPVIAGPFEGRAAKFIEQQRDNVRLMLSFFGAQRPVVIPVEQVLHE